MKFYNLGLLLLVDVVLILCTSQHVHSTCRILSKYIGSSRIHMAYHNTCLKFLNKISETPCQFGRQFISISSVFFRLHKILTEGLQLDGPKLNQPKWKFSTFCGLYGTTSYPQLPLRRVDPPDTRSHPQGGVQVYPKGKFTRQNQEKKSYASPAPIFTKFTYKIEIII